ncbi:MAG: helix-turn-helix transcriptional regulator [Bacteroidales bacterium]|nr:helix-turn-helix transcriptional regulator [Bacteroidales bacterium]
MKTELEMINVCVLNVGFTRTERHFGGPELSSPFARLYYFKSGKAVIHLPDRELEAKPGYMYLVPSFMPHSYLCEPGSEFYYLFVYERYGKQSDIFDLYSFPYEVKANHAIDLLFENYCNFYPELNLPYHGEENFYTHPSFFEYVVRYSQMDRYEKMQLLGFIWIIASFFMKHSSERLGKMDERMVKVMRYVNENIKKEITNDELAELACVTKSHLGRMFRNSLGISPLQFVIHYRVKCAQRLLMTTEYSISQIAAEVGYDDVSYFIRVFRKGIGITPQEYRNRLKY